MRLDYWSKLYFAPSALPKAIYIHPGRCPGLLHFAPLALGAVTFVARKQAFLARKRPIVATTPAIVATKQATVATREAFVATRRAFVASEVTLALT
jgi:hypothetical protein